MQNLKEITVSVNQLFLDPNNPRYADIADQSRLVPLERVAEERVQKRAFERILNFDIQPLKDSIRTIGFLTVDRMVVVVLPQSDKYMVVEGNRRLAAIKSLLEELDGGEIDISEEVLPTLQNVPVLVLEETDPIKREHLARVLQGVRHVSSIRSWGPYQQAQVVVMLLDEEGREPNEVKEILGLNMRRINILRRCWKALQQMKNDVDYGEFAKARMFSFFEEIFKSPALYKNWLDWDNETGVFRNEENRKRFYGWIAGEEQDGEQQPPKLTDSREVRRLGDLMEDPVQFQRFCDTPGLKLEDALRGVVTAGPQIDWRAILNSNLHALKQVPAVDLQKATDGDVDLLDRIRQLANDHMRIIRSFQQSGESADGDSEGTNR